jgi:hypothetical protein
MLNCTCTELRELRGSWQDYSIAFKLETRWSMLSVAGVHINANHDVSKQPVSANTITCLDRLPSCIKSVQQRRFKA